jgi:L-threonylcarbamoyladenylate synthase
MNETNSKVIHPASPDALAEAAGLLQAGRLVAFPTETVYGLGADAANDRAVAEIFAAKGRPRFNPLIVHLADAAAAERAALFCKQAQDLAARFWPGPLTLVLPRRSDSRVSLLCSAGLDSLAVRVPNHALAQDLLQAFGGPLAAPSANPSGRVSPTTARHVALALGDQVAAVLDGGPCRIGLESTVLDLSGPSPRLLRPGGLPQEDLEAILGPLARPLTRHGENEAPRAPGMLASHYAPALPLRLDAEWVDGSEALLAFGAQPLSGAAKTINLSPTGDLTEAAANLFAALHDLDRAGFSAIAVMPMPESGLGHAINDRLQRAAAPRNGSQAAALRRAGQP